MRFRSLVVPIAIATVSSLATWHWASAQVPQKDDFLQIGVISGADIGFRVEGVRDNIASGRLMVRINGRWVEAGPSQFASMRQLSQR